MVVSCIMPTRDRHPFVNQAVKYFFAQTYSDKELIIIDDSESACPEQFNTHSNISYIHLNSRTSIGKKRNLACQLAKGEYICHWDDDDWMAPDRIEKQLKSLKESKADLCGLRSLYYLDPKRARAWYYKYPTKQRPWVAGGTLFYRHEVWESNHFEDMDVGEDTRFIWRSQDHSDAKVHVMNDESIYVGLIHDTNVSPKAFSDTKWQQRDINEVTRLINGDASFYTRLRTGTVAEPGAVSKGNYNRLRMAADFIVYDGYGSMSEYLANGLASMGVKLDLFSLTVDRKGLSDELLKLLDQSNGRSTRISSTDNVLYFSWPNENLPQFLPASNLFIYTMWEASHLPPGWTAALNQCRAVIVPTRFVARVCRESGVSVPVYVAPQGVDEKVYHFIERPRRKPLTCLIVGTVVPRKHVLEAIEGWKRAFPANGVDADKVTLIIKSRFRYGNYQPDDSRIQFVDDNETTRGILHWYERADVLIAVGNEGFGLPLVEAMATGLPVIALNSEGQSDVCEDAHDLVLPVSSASWEVANEAPFGDGGIRAVPDVDDIARHLRWVFENRKAASKLGKAASEWVIKYRNLRDFPPAVLNAIEQTVQPSRNFHRFDTLWVPSWGTPCGIAEYSRDLLEHSKGWVVSKNQPDMTSVRTLHIQHQYELYDQAEMVNAIYQAKSHGVPVVITEHTVIERKETWEKEADLLLALTPSGEEMLSRKWPQKVVARVPHACPNLNYPRKTKAGLTIAVFGFLERHKGYWSLLEVLPEIPGSELLMLSHCKHKDLELEWEHACKDLPVRREKSFLAADRAIEKLAAEADVLVYWYDEIAASSASGAVRIGLASGVPVLSSPVSWFEELRDVTYQPDNLLDGVKRLLGDKQLQQSLSEKALRFCKENNWQQSAELHNCLRQQHLAYNN